MARLKRGRSVALWLAVAILAILAGLAEGAPFSCLNLDVLGSGGELQGLVARPGALGNAIWNPSGLAGLEASQGIGFAGYMDYLADTRGATAGYVWSPKSGRGFGVFVSYLSAGSIPRSTWSDPVGGDESFSYGEVLGGFAGGGAVGRRCRIGANLKLDRENMDDIAVGGAFADLSATARIAELSSADQGPGVFFSAAARNITLTRWGTGATAIPITAELGLAAVLPVGLSAGAAWLEGGQGRRELRAGLAALLSDEFEARLGWRRRIGTGSDSAYHLPWQRGLVAGFGVRFAMFWLDYTYEDASPLDAIHRFGLRVDGAALARSHRN